MHKKIVINSAALIAITACHWAAADTAGLKRCANIGSPLDRLECYDALARSTGAAPLSPRPASPPTRAAAKPAPAPLPTVKPAEPVPVADKKADPSDFGFTGKRARETPKKVTAHYDGEFTGWSGQTLFKLENGQVWRQTESGRMAFQRDRPLITIKRGAFGGYKLSVEGSNRTVRVKRVK